MTRKINLTFTVEWIALLTKTKDPENGKELQIVHLGLLPDEKKTYI